MFFLVLFPGAYFVPITIHENFESVIWQSVLFSILNAYSLPVGYASLLIMIEARGCLGKPAPWKKKL